MSNPSTLIFLGLAVVWAIVLLPEGIKKLSKVRRSDSIRSFNHQLSVLDRNGHGRTTNVRGAKDVLGSSPRRPVRAVASRSNSNVIDLRERRSAGSPVAGPQGGQAGASAGASIPMAVRKRRQEVIATLAAVSVLSLLCVIAFGSAFLIVNLVSVALLVGYLFLVSQANKSLQVNQSMRARAASTHYTGGSVTRIESNGLRPVTPGRLSTGSVPAVVATRSARTSL